MYRVTLDFEGCSPVIDWAGTLAECQDVIDHYVNLFPRHKLIDRKVLRLQRPKTKTELLSFLKKHAAFGSEK